MIGFHIDMNVAQFTRPYLEKWLKELAERGYNTILWEVEDNIQWQTCPECASPEAFSKAEFKEILSLCRQLKLEPIPLLQTIGHCEYVLKHDKYKHLAEIADGIDQYCPRNPDVVPFLHKWIEEYIELFGDIKYFHLGADEAWSLGHCDACSLFARQNSLSQLYIDHINAVSGKFAGTGIKPIIWADMVLHHHEALDKLSRNIMLFDWMYDMHRGKGKIMLWGKGQITADQLTKEEKETFGKYIFPYGDEPGRDPEAFYTTDYLANNGFDVVTCPASASAGDSAFVPRNWYHVSNTFDFFTKGQQSHLCGSVLTSWTVRLHPWEMQTSCIDMPGFLSANPKASLGDFQKHYAKDRFGLDDNTIWQACGLLSKPCVFMTTAELGFDKHTLPAPADTIQRQIIQFAQEDKLSQELENCENRLREYEHSLKLFGHIGKTATKGQELIKLWKLAARNQINRAQVAAFLIKTEIARQAELQLQRSHFDNGKKLLEQMRQLKEETDLMYQASIKPIRRAQIISWIYDSIEFTMVAILEQ